MLSIACRCLAYFPKTIIVIAGKCINARIGYFEIRDLKSNTCYLTVRHTTIEYIKLKIDHRT